MNTTMSGLRRRVASGIALLAALGLSAGMACAAGVAGPGDEPGEDWRETYAYTLGTQAFVFGFPWVFLPEIIWRMAVT